MIQFGFDIATSISIIGAAISFLISQRKSREQSRSQYATTNLIRFLDMIRDFSAQYDSIGNELRTSPSQQALDKNILETIFFLEALKRELERQSQMYFPLFSIEGKTPAEISNCEKELDTLLEQARKGRESFANVSKEVEPMLKKIERSVIDELKKNMKNG